MVQNEIAGNHGNIPKYGNNMEIPQNLYPEIADSPKYGNNVFRPTPHFVEKTASI